MKISVLIPAYNSAATIVAALDSVLAQTSPPGEVLVMDDGSTDNTVELVGRYAPRVRLLKQPNRGVAEARNVLVRHASGELLAFLDHDDVWHPEYLAAQGRRFQEYPHASIFFTGHRDVAGLGKVEWENETRQKPASVQIIPPLEFLRQYHRQMGKFGSMSFCCIPRKMFWHLGEQPFCPEVAGVDDYHLFHKLLLAGPVIYTAETLAAYRITSGNQSASLLKSVEKAVRALELLKPYYHAHATSQMRKVFGTMFAISRREHGRVLMGAGRYSEARQALIKSLAESQHPVSLAKSACWLLLTLAPRTMQPKWPADLKISHAQIRQLQATPAGGSETNG